MTAEYRDPGAHPTTELDLSGFHRRLPHGAIAAIVIDGALARSDPPLYRFLGRFGHDNHLRVSEY